MWMEAWLDTSVIVVSAVLAIMAAVFVAGKLRGSRRRASMAERRQRYVETLSQMVLDQTFPRSIRREAGDPVFRTVLLEYLRFLEGDEREFLLQVAGELKLVDKFVKELHHPVRDIRVRAAEALTEFADPHTVEALLVALSDKTPEVRIQAVAALSRIGDARAVKPILSQLDREDQWAANRIADSLVHFGPNAVAAMAEYVDRSGRYATLVIRALGRIGDYQAEQVLLQALDDPDLDVRIRAVGALGRTGTPAGLQELVQAMRDSAWEVRAQAAKSLGEIGDQMAMPVLRHALRDTSWWVRNNAAAALAEIPGGLEVLRDALDDHDPYARDIAAATLLAAGEARKAMRNVQAEDPLQRERARQLIRKLAKSGKGEYFRQAIQMGDEVERDAVARVVDLEM